MCSTLSDTPHDPTYMTHDRAVYSLVSIRITYTHPYYYTTSTLPCIMHGTEDQARKEGFDVARWRAGEQRADASRWTEALDLLRHKISNGNRRSHANLLHPAIQL